MQLFDRLESSLRAALQTVSEQAEYDLQDVTLRSETLITSRREFTTHWGAKILTVLYASRRTNLHLHFSPWCFVEYFTLWTCDMSECLSFSILRCFSALSLPLVHWELEIFSVLLVWTATIYFVQNALCFAARRVDRLITRFCCCRTNGSDDLQQAQRNISAKTKFFCSPVRSQICISWGAWAVLKPNVSRIFCLTRAT